MDINQGDITGHLVLLMAPSGSGKGKIIEGLGELAEHLYFLKTYTSRERRKGTEENPKYQFVTREAFEKMVTEDAFVEWANYSGNLYGTAKAEIFVALKEGKVAFKEMELQGIMQMKELVPEEHMTVIYIDAGGWDALERRITERAAIDPSELELRRQRYEEESKTKDIANVVIENHDGMLQLAQDEFKKTIQHIIQTVNK